MNYTISETYTLPSLGKVYDRAINPEVRLRSMTTLDEMKRLSKTDKQYQIMAEILDDCLIDDLGMSSYDLCFGDFQFLIHKLRVVTYGPEYPLQSKCPNCLSVLDDVINLDDLQVLEYTEDIGKYFEFDLPITKKHIKIRMQTPRMMDNVAALTKAEKRRNKSSVDSAFLFTLESLIDEIDYKKPTTIEVEEFVKNLPMLDTQHIVARGKKLNEAIGLDLTLLNKCEVCGTEFASSFRTTSEFFGPTIDI